MNLRDYAATAGLGLALAGLALLSIPVALIVAGCVTTALAVSADRRRPR